MQLNYGALINRIANKHLPKKPLRITPNTFAGIIKQIIERFDKEVDSELMQDLIEKFIVY